MRQYAGYTSAYESNKRYHDLLQNGVMGLSIAFDLPTQIGYDSDHSMSEGEVGKVGVPICHLSDMEILLKDIPLDKISTSMTINATAPILLAFYIAIAEKNNIPLNKISGTIQNDILKEYIARGTYIFPPKPSMKLITDIFEFCDSNMPKWNTISISGYHIREAGSTVEQELGFTFSNAIAYVQSAIDSGLDPNKFGQQISFFFNSHNGFLEEISKFRAARAIWASIMKNRFGVSNKKALMCRFHTQTGGSTLTASQIDNNIVRTTIQAMSAVLGGTQSLHTNSKDEAISLPTNESATLALRTQQLIAYESGLKKYPDPFGGSYLIEEMTKNIIQKSNKIINYIDSIGGAVSAIEDGYVQEEINKSAYDFQKKVDSNEKIIVGVNKFMDTSKEEHNLLKIDLNLVSKQIESLKNIKKSRNNDQVKNNLEKLKSSAKSNKNLMPTIINCVKNDCTLGEISDALRSIYGEHKSF
tara:strand:+ start:10 stop:1425 length:1416 start_codon:yes stop_codon:yes gene_type:complete